MACRMALAFGVSADNRTRPQRHRDPANHGVGIPCRMMSPCPNTGTRAALTKPPESGAAFASINLKTVIHYFSRSATEVPLDPVE